MKSRINLGGKEVFANVFAKLGMFAAVALLATSVHAASSPVFLLLDSTTGYFTDGAPETDVYVNFTHKITDRYSITPEMNNIIYYKKKVVKASDPTKPVEINQLSLAHDLLRLTITDGALGQIGGWKLTAVYQYAAPTVPALEKAGALGAVYYRPAITRTVGMFDLLFRNRFGLYLQRAAYTLNDPAKTGNPLYDNMMEFNASMTVGAGFGLSIYLADRHTYVMSDYGKNFTRWSNRYFQELEVNYTAEALAKTNFALVLGNDSRYGVKADKTQNKFQPFAGTNTQVYLRVSKVFE